MIACEDRDIYYNYMKYKKNYVCVQLWIEEGMKCVELWYQGIQGNTHRVDKTSVHSRSTTTNYREIGDLFRLAQTEEEGDEVSNCRSSSIICLRR